MAPPFIAYHGLCALHIEYTEQNSQCPPTIGALNGKKGLLIEAYNQIRLYRDALTQDSSGLWQHIVQGNSGSQDHSHWATGNGWAASGMLRVLYTIHASSFSDQLKSQQSDLVEWISEIVDNAWEHQVSSGALLNHIDEAGSFIDASGTALLAAATFRLAVFTSNPRNVKNAVKARKWVLETIDEDGWLKEVVNPYDWHEEGEVEQ